MTTPPPTLRRLESPLLLGEEAAVWCRFCSATATPRELRNGAESVKQLVRDGRLRAIRLGKSYRYPLQELQAFVERELERAETSGTESEPES